VKIRFKNRRLITLRKKKRNKLAEIIQASRFQEEMFGSLDEQVGRDSIVRIIDKVVDKLKEKKPGIKIKQTEAGRPEYPRGALLKLYLYGYMNRIKSSRKLERECKINIEVMWLLGKLSPDHWTISNFRKENQEQIKRIIRVFNKFLIESGYLEGKTIVIDGTKIKANASASGNMNIEEIAERLEDVENKIVYYLEAIDEEDERTEEIEKLKKEKEQLLKQIEKLEEENKRVYIKTDPDANIIRTKNGKIAGYNVQLSCDRKNKLIVATDVSSQTNDFKQLKNMYQNSKKMLGDKPEEVIADAGYYVPEQIEQIEKEEKVSTYVSPLPERKKGEFEYNAPKDQYTCQKGKVLVFEKEKKDVRGRSKRYYRSGQCEGCSIRKGCTSSDKGRIKIRYVNQDFRDSYRERMMQRKSKEKIKLRKTIVEHPIGTIKLWLGKNPLLLRGKEKVKTEISLVSLSYNLLRIFNIDGYESLSNKIENYDLKLA
jgi:transposase